jgi:Domain of unknown function (DUF4956)
MLLDLLQLVGIAAAPSASVPAAPFSSVALLTRLAIDLTCVALLVRGVYFRHYARASLVLTFFTCNVVIFLITYLMNAAEMSMGAAFGLFAVFSMLRYRTEGISAKDMTYLFLVIALGLIMAVGSANLLVLASIGLGLVLITALLESNLVVRREHTQSVLYDKVALLHAHARNELLADLRTRTGLEVHRVDVDEIDLLRDTARLTLFYHGS